MPYKGLLHVPSKILSQKLLQDKTKSKQSERVIRFDISNNLALNIYLSILHISLDLILYVLQFFEGLSSTTHES